MTIHNPEQFVAGLWDWAMLEGCFGNTRIMPTDCEGLVERNARVLYLETKRPGAAIPYGQNLMFERLRHTGIFTIIVIWGHRNQPEHPKTYTARGVSQVFQCDTARLRDLVSRWFAYADRQQPLRVAS